MVITFKDTALPNFRKQYPEIDSPTGAIADMWKAMLFNGGLEVEFFELEETTEKILVRIKRGWLGEELVEFLVNQPEVEEVFWDYETYYPPGVDEEEKEREKERLREEAWAKEMAKMKAKKKKKKKQKQEQAKTEL